MLLNRQVPQSLVVINQHIHRHFQKIKKNNTAALDKALMKSL